MVILNKFPTLPRQKIFIFIFSILIYKTQKKTIRKKCFF